MKAVRIGIDARKLHDFGIGTYIRNMLHQLARLDERTEYVVLCRPGDVDDIGRRPPDGRVYREARLAGCGLPGEPRGLVERPEQVDLRIHHHLHGHCREQLAVAALADEGPDERAVLQL